MIAEWFLNTITKKMVTNSATLMGKPNERIYVSVGIFHTKGKHPKYKNGQIRSSNSPTRSRLLVNKKELDAILCAHKLRSS